ncbi:uncharacterized protein TM35_000211180 [Trypanosoma theileri]|uniref:Uncharacterized protein n=1 Tax=Trypanosoma theileri TaxID=67003 RepID=A0A1X0NS28_9TRYP|nr:uncharacterized protein TM35_000211180 [Trypanosoma theileri]ORC87512.1 hypothetical protein TM35_000211180 [Trypanosoma theileri]
MNFPKGYFFQKRRLLLPPGFVSMARSLLRDPSGFCEAPFVEKSKNLNPFRPMQRRDFRNAWRHGCRTKRKTRCFFFFFLSEPSSTNARRPAEAQPQKLVSSNIG